MLLEAVADIEIADRRRVQVPGAGMRARPVPGRRRADLERHPVALRRCCSASRAPSRGPSRARDSAPASRHWPRTRRRPAPPPSRADRQSRPLRRTRTPATPSIALQQRHRRRLVQDRDALALGAAVQRLHQFLAAAPDVAGEPAPELELAVDAETPAGRAPVGSARPSRASTRRSRSSSLSGFRSGPGRCGIRSAGRYRRNTVPRCRCRHRHFPARGR